MSATRYVPPPAVMPPYPVRQALAVPISTLRYFLGKFYSKMSLLMLLLLINSRSFPGVWHLRMLLHAYQYRIAHLPVKRYFPFIKDHSAVTTTHKINPQLRMDALPLGKDIFRDVTVLPFRAWPDDCE